MARMIKKVNIDIDVKVATCFEDTFIQSFDDVLKAIEKAKDECVDVSIFVFDNASGELIGKTKIYDGYR
jgi:hypothetical protein